MSMRVPREYKHTFLGYLCIQAIFENVCDFRKLLPSIISTLKVLIFHIVATNLTEEKRHKTDRAF